MVEYAAVNLVAGVVGMGVLGTGYVLVRREREALGLFVLSVAVGAGLLFVAVTPDSFDAIATFLGLEFKTHAILVVANLVLFALVTYLLYRIGRLYDRLSRLNEEVSLLKTELEDGEE
ncbi:MAG: hypothetical protein ACI9CA_000199 [Natronomonas sp.]|jgi:hypothetical protein